MPNIKSAIKRVKTSERNRVNNLIIKSQVKTAIRKLKDLVATNKTSEDINLLHNDCKSLIDKAVSKGVYKKNTASRKKSRLASFLNKALETVK